MDFANIYAQGFARVAACTFPVALADPAANVATVTGLARDLHEQAVAVAVFPELCLTGYSLEDLFGQDVLLDAAETALFDLAAATADLAPLLLVGVPLRADGRLHNCAVAVHRGRILGAAPKSYLPTYREFYERRQFAPGDDRAGASVRLRGTDYPLGPDLVFTATDVPGLAVHAEVCEDMWVPIPPHALAALGGATVLANLSGSPITVGKADTRHLHCRAASARCTAAYVYAAAGEGESTTDLSWDGQTMIYEAGELLAQTERFPDSARVAVADIDLRRLSHERRRTGTVDDNRRAHATEVDHLRRVEFTLAPPPGDLGLRRALDRFPFVPNDPTRLAQDCYEAYAIQVSGLEQRLRSIGHPKLVIGVSGGLDSTHALIVAARAMDRLGRPRSDILAYTMPGFATSDGTRTNAEALATSLGVTFDTLDIRPAATRMLTDLRHPAADGRAVYDVTFENVQAGLRTDYLFRLAGQHGAIVLGTGDLSELALGWCTYGVGDQMSHYNVNGGVPKTLMQHLIRWVAASGQFDDDVAAVLRDILATEISPELVPVAPGEKPQSTQDAIGPYELHDFTLFHVLRHGMPPSRVAFLAWHAWRDAQTGQWPVGVDGDDRHAYDLPTIKGWLAVFVRRFFAFAQFKRSALPNGPKVSAGGSLSPRGDWRAPSEPGAHAWLADLDQVP